MIILKRGSIFGAGPFSLIHPNRCSMYPVYTCNVEVDRTGDRIVLRQVTVPRWALL